MEDYETLENLFKRCSMEELRALQQALSEGPEGFEMVLDLVEEHLTR